MVVGGGGGGGGGGVGVGVAVGGGVGVAVGLGVGVGVGEPEPPPDSSAKTLKRISAAMRTATTIVTLSLVLLEVFIVGSLCLRRNVRSFGI